MQTRTEEITTASGPMGVHAVRPDGDGPFPVIVFFHHGPGLDDGIEADAWRRIAERGYYVVSARPGTTARRAVVHDRPGAAEGQGRGASRCFGLVLGTTEDQSRRARPRRASSTTSAAVPASGAVASALGCIGYCIARRTVRPCARWRGTWRAVPVPASACTRRSAPPTTATRHISQCRPTPVVVHRVRLGRHHATRICQHGAHRGDERLGQGRGQIHDGADHGFGVYGPGHHEAGHAVLQRAKLMFDRELKV